MKKIKKGLKIATVALTIISIIGCSTSHKQAYVYKEELKEFTEQDELPEGELRTQSEDGSIVKLTVNKKHKIVEIQKISTLYKTKGECTSKLLDDYNNLKASLINNGGKFKDEEKHYNFRSLYSHNKEFNIMAQKCYDNDYNFQYSIAVTPKQNDKNIPREVAHTIVTSLGVVIALPFMIVGMALAVAVAGIVMLTFKIAGVKF